MSNSMIPASTTRQGNLVNLIGAIRCVDIEARQSIFTEVRMVSQRRRQIDTSSVTLQLQI